MENIRPVEKKKKNTAQNHTYNVIHEESRKDKGIIKISVQLYKILRTTYSEDMTLKSNSILCLIFIFSVPIFCKIAKRLEHFTEGLQVLFISNFRLF